VLRLAGGRRPREERDPEDHGGHAQDLALPHPLSKEAGADDEEHDEAHRQGRLDEREWDQQERADLRHPPEQRKAGPEEPARPGDQAPEQGEAEMLLVGRLPRLERLQPDRRCVEDRGREGEREAGDDFHGQGAR
jgi:hypothetical protein